VGGGWSGWPGAWVPVGLGVALALALCTFATWAALRVALREVEALEV
ncbi:MAG: hypothetical protein HY702_06180, partial [Gemmatimonadetes bacterium]|nr:hypothetical protein [Gemmatimonadota bacterium]